MTAPARRSAPVDARSRRRIGRSGADADAPLTTAALLQLIRLASPSLPVGGFSYSEGVESAVDAGFVNDEASARRWLRDRPERGIGRSALPVAARALAAWRREDRAAVAAWNAWFGATRETSEL